MRGILESEDIMKELDQASVAGANLGTYYTICGS